MGSGISEVLGPAVGVAISPIPIIAVILMLFTKRARVNGPMFGVGWVVALAVVSGAAYALSDVGDASTNSTTSDTISWVKLVFGVLLLAGALRTWRRRPTPGETAPMPGWMASIDTLVPVKALVLGLLLAGVNPKNLLLAIAAGSGVAQAGASGGDAIVALAVFVVVGSVSIAGPVAYYLVGGASAERSLERLKGWLGAHNDAVMTVLLLVIGVNLIADGLRVLT